MFGPKLTTWLSKSVEYLGTRANIFFINIYIIFLTMPNWSVNLVDILFQPKCFTCLFRQSGRTIYVFEHNSVKIVSPNKHSHFCFKLRWEQRKFDKKTFFGLWVITFVAFSCYE